MSKNDYISKRAANQEILGFSANGDPIEINSLSERIERHKTKIVGLGLHYTELMKRVEIGNGEVRGEIENLLSLYSRKCFRKFGEEYDPFEREEIHSQIEKTAKALKIKLKLGNDNIEMYPLF